MTKKRKKEVLIEEEKCDRIVINFKNHATVSVFINVDDCSDLSFFKKNHSVFLKNTRISCSKKLWVYNKLREGRNTMVFHGEQLPIDIDEAAKFIVQYYYRCDGKITCTRTKVEKLLAIANLVCIKRGQPLFSENMFIKLCGVTFPTLVRTIPSDIFEGSVEEDGNPIQFLNPQANIPIKYRDVDIPDFVKALLKDVFLTFGNFNGMELGKLLDEFKEEISVKNESTGKSYIDTKLAYDFLSERPNSNNKILSYIMEYEFTNEHF